MTATPTPGDLSARHVEVLRRFLRMNNALLYSGEREALDAAIAALSALPAAGGEAVAVVIPNVVGVEIAWIDPPSAGRPPVGTKLYTPPKPSAAEEPDGYTSFGEFRHACDADERMRAEWTPLYFSAPPAAGGYERMFHAAVASLAEISAELGIPDDVALVANGNAEMLHAIRTLKARQPNGREPCPCMDPSCFVGDHDND